MNPANLGNPATPIIIETLGKDGILAIRPIQRAVLADADRIEDLAKAARPRSYIRTAHETAAAAIRTVALDSRFFLNNDQARKDIQTITKGHESLIRLLTSFKNVDRGTQKKVMQMDFTVWNLIASRYPDEVGIRA